MVMIAGQLVMMRTVWIAMMMVMMRQIGTVEVRLSIRVMVRWDNLAVRVAGADIVANVAINCVCVCVVGDIVVAVVVCVDCWVCIICVMMMMMLIKCTELMMMVMMMMVRAWCC